MQTLVRGDVSVALLSDVTLNAGLADGISVGAVYPKSGVPATEIALFCCRRRSTRTRAR